jgi:hypothetical protein
MVNPSAMKKGMASLEGDNLVVFNYFRSSEIWSHKKGGLTRGELLVCYLFH